MGSLTPGARERGPLALDSERNRRIVDGFRAIGILLVIFFHVLLAVVHQLAKNDAWPGLERLVADFPRVFNIAWQAMGSEIVFVLSGFLISYLLLRELAQTGRIRLREYLIKRGSRILPLYALALCIFVFTRRFHADDFALNLLFVSKLFHQRTTVPVGWSLELIVQMYLLLPLIVLLVVRCGRPLVAIGGLLVLSVATRFIALWLHPEAYHTPLYTLIEGAGALRIQEDLYYLLWYRATPFLLGLLAAYLLVHREALLERVFRGRSRAALFLGGATLLLVATGCLPVHDKHSFLYAVERPGFWLAFKTLQRPLFGAGVALALLTCVSSGSGLVAWIGDRLTWKPFSTVSRNIYSIYLFHLIWLIPSAALVSWSVDRESLREVPTFDVIAAFALAALLSVSFAKVVTRYVEQPCQRWIRNRLLRPRPAVAASSSGVAPALTEGAPATVPPEPPVLQRPAPLRRPSS